MERISAIFAFAGPEISGAAHTLDLWGVYGSGPVRTWATHEEADAASILRDWIEVGNDIQLVLDAKLAENNTAE